MGSEKVTVVPVKLESTSTPASNQSSSFRPICIIQAPQLKISFYPGVKNYVVETIMKELKDCDS